MNVLLNPMWWIEGLAAGFWWWMYCVLASMAALPLMLRCLRTLPDRGAGVSIIFGLAFVEFFAWALALDWLSPRGAAWFRCIMMVLAAGGFIAAALRGRKLKRRWPAGVPRAWLARLYFAPAAVAFAGLVHLPHGALSIWFALGVLAVSSAVAWLGNSRDLRRALRVAFHPFLIAQLLFLLGFVFFLNVRSYIPAATFESAEKFGNLMHLNSMMRARTMPPGDAWFFGQPDNYYYGGHLFVATIAKAIGMESRFAFNLGLATVFGLTLSTSFAFVFNLVARRPARRSLRRLRTIWHCGTAWGLFGALAIGCFGNLDAWHQLLSRDAAYARPIVRAQLYEQLGPKYDDEGELIQALDRALQRRGALLFSEANIASIDYWRSSRAIHGAPPGVTEPGTITEFPYFSAILGDLHPHHMALPFTLFALTVMVSLLRSHSRHIWTAEQWLLRRVAGLVLLGAAGGMVFTVNIWDAIVLAPLGLLTVVVPLWRGRWSWPALPSIILSAAVAIVVLLPFKLFFHAPLQPVDQSALMNQAALSISGHRVLSIVPHLLRTSMADYFVHWGLFLVPIILFLFTRVLSGLQDSSEGRGFAEGAGLLALLVGGRVFLNSWTAPVAMCLAVMCLLVTFRARDGREAAALAFAAVAFFFHGFVEVFYFEDSYTGYLERYNTVFKLYYPLWPMLAAAMVFAFVYAHERLAWGPLVRFAILAVAGLGFLYPLGATLNRTQSFADDDQRSLDALAFMRHHELLRHDYEAIEWLAKNAPPGARILEMPPSFDSEDSWANASYSPAGRFSASTGVPTLIGWAHHELQWRGWGSRVPPEIAFRFAPYFRPDELQLDPVVRIIFPEGESDEQQAAVKALALMPADVRGKSMRALLSGLTEAQYEGLLEMLAEPQAGNLSTLQLVNRIISHADTIYSAHEIGDEVADLIGFYSLDYIIVGSLEQKRYGQTGGLGKFAVWQPVFQNETAIIYQVPHFVPKAGE